MCPSSATITSFFTFVAGNKAKASEANTNFSNFRGFLLPVNTDTTTASDNTHDLGATDHRWRRIYLGEPPYINGSQIGKIEIQTVFPGSSPPDFVAAQDDLSRLGFITSSDSDIAFQFVVPSEYKPGNRIAITMRGYSETTGAAVFYSRSRLYRMGVTPGNSVPSAVLTGTSTLSNSVAGLFFEDSSLKLTDASGLINGTTVTVGNIISVNLKRATADASDVNSGTVYLTDLVVDLNN